MSLENPTILDKTINWLKASANRRIIIYVVAALFVIGLVLFAFDRCGNWKNNRQIEKLRTNVSLATNELKQVQSNIANAKQDEAVKLQAVNIAVNDYTAKSNATDAAKAATNQAIVNMQSAVNANKSVDVTASDLENQLKEIQ